MAKSKKRRKLTPKQIKFFGTKAQKAALKRKRGKAAKNKPSSRKSSSTKKKKKKTTTSAGVNPLLAGAIGLAAGTGAGYLAGTNKDKVLSLLSKIPGLEGLAPPPAPVDPAVALIAPTAPPAVAAATPVNSLNRQWALENYNPVVQEPFPVPTQYVAPPPTTTQYNVPPPPTTTQSRMPTEQEMEDAWSHLAYADVDKYVSTLGGVGVGYEDLF